MRRRFVVFLLLFLFTVQACGSSATISNSLDVASAQVTVLPSVTSIPLNSTTHFSIKLTSASGANQVLENSLKGASDSYPPQTQGRALSSAFPTCTTVMAVMNLDTSTPGIALVSPAPRSLDDTEADWNVDITPQATGTLTLDGEIDVEWSGCANGNNTPEFRLAPVYQQFTVYDPHPARTFFNNFFNNPIVVAVLAALLASLITWIVVQIWNRLRRKKKQQKKRQHAASTDAVADEQKREAVRMEVQQQGEQVQQSDAPVQKE